MKPSRRHAFAVIAATAVGMLALPTPEASGAGPDGTLDATWGSNGRVDVPAPEAPQTIGLTTFAAGGTVFVQHESKVHTIQFLGIGPPNVGQSCPYDGNTLPCTVAVTPGNRAANLTDGAHVLGGDVLGVGYLMRNAEAGQTFTGAVASRASNGAAFSGAVFVTVTPVSGPPRLQILDTSGLVDVGPAGTVEVLSDGTFAVASASDQTVTVRRYQSNGRPASVPDVVRTFPGQRASVRAVVADAHGGLGVVIDHIRTDENANGWPLNSSLLTIDASATQVGLLGGTSQRWNPIAVDVPGHRVALIGTQIGTTQTTVAIADLDQTTPAWQITTLAAGGPAFVDHAVVDAQGRILVVGGDGPFATESAIKVARFLPNGAIDTSFGTSGLSTVPLPSTTTAGFRIALDGTGVIVAAPQPATVAVFRLDGSAAMAQRTRYPFDALSTTGAQVTSAYVGIPPIRVIDTRDTAAIRAGQSATLDLSSLLPSTATAVAVNVTVPDATAPGFLTLASPSSIDAANVSTLNVSAKGETVANAAIVPIAADRLVAIRPSMNAHVVVDVVGYWRATDRSTSGRYVPLDAPIRAIDTRNSGPRLAAGTVTRVALRPYVASGASAAVVTLTATTPAGAGYFTVWPGDQSWPGTSSLNVNRAGEDRANLAIVPLGPDGTVNVLNDPAAHVIVDVLGYFTGSNDVAARRGLFVASEPQRLVDTRAGDGRPTVPAGSSLLVDVCSSEGATIASAFNLTAVGVSASGYLTATGDRAAVSETSSVNYDAPGQTRATMAITGDPSALAKIWVGGQGSVDLLVDRAGCFVG